MMSNFSTYYFQEKSPNFSENVIYIYTILCVEMYRDRPLDKVLVCYVTLTHQWISPPLLRYLLVLDIGKLLIDE